MSTTIQADISITPLRGVADRDWLLALWRREWLGEFVVTRGRVHRLDDLQAVIALDINERVGAATFRIDGDNCELVSLNVLTPALGIGTRLVEAVQGIAQANRCQRLTLITTNDNIESLRFYQRRGFCLSEIHPGAIDAMRRLKPTIPLIGAHGIPVRDEIELELVLQQ